MEEQILKILENNRNIFKEDDGTISIGGVNTFASAKEITSHIYEFIEWLSFGSHPFIAWLDENGHYFTDEINDKRWSIEELYQYWLNNVYKPAK